MSDKKKTWIAIVVAVLIVAGMLGIAFIGGVVYVFGRHVDAQFVSADRASDEFQRERQRFAGQQPLIEFADHDQSIIHQRTAASRTELQTLRILAFDASAGKLVRMSVPFWVLRMAPSRHFSFRNDYIEFETDRVSLTLDDVERAGPGLLLDGRSRRNGGQVLVWTE